jgi:hypothetical protein
MLHFFDRQAQQALALWAAGCVEHVLGLFEAQQPHDDRPRKAMAVAAVNIEMRLGYRSDPAQL